LHLSKLTHNPFHIHELLWLILRFYSGLILPWKS